MADWSHRHPFHVQQSIKISFFLEICVLHGFCRRYSMLMVHHQHPLQQVQCLLCCEFCVRRVHHLRPRLLLPRLLSYYLDNLFVGFQFVLTDVCLNLWRPDLLQNDPHLVMVASSSKYYAFLKNLQIRRKCTSPPKTQPNDQISKE